MTDRPRRLLTHVREGPMPVAGEVRRGKRYPSMSTQLVAIHTGHVLHDTIHRDGFQPFLHRHSPPLTLMLRASSAFTNASS